MAGPLGVVRSDAAPTPFVPYANSRSLMPPPLIHVVGAGLAGLAAALRIADAGAKAIVHEAAGQAGARCRSQAGDSLKRGAQFRS